MSFPGRAYNILRGYVSREWDRIQGVEREYAEIELRQLEEPAKPEKTPPSEPADQETHARRILGLSGSASYRDVRRAFDRLSRRSDPSNFPAGSPEREKAADIHKRVQWAFRVLSEGVDVTEKRFQSLELD